MAVISGAGAGIGKATAKMFAREGASVVIADLDRGKGRAVEAEIGDAAMFIHTDVTEEKSVKDLMNEAIERFGSLNILFNCAGGSVVGDTLVTEVDMGVWEHTIPLDLRGPFLCSRFGIPKLIENGGGSVINVSSVVALRGNHPAHVYSTAKGGLISFTRSLAGAYSWKGVRANVICPGLVAANRIKNKPVSSRRSEMVETYKKYKFGSGEPDDIANVALFLASEESRMVNAAVIPADGGISAY